MYLFNWHCIETSMHYYTTHCKHRYISMCWRDTFLQPTHQYFVNAKSVSTTATERGLSSSQSFRIIKIYFIFKHLKVFTFTVVGELFLSKAILYFHFPSIFHSHFIFRTEQSSIFKYWKCIALNIKSKMDMKW